MTVAQSLFDATPSNTGKDTVRPITEKGDDSGASDRAAFVLKDASGVPSDPYLIAITVDVFETAEGATAYHTKTDALNARGGPVSVSLACGRIYIGVGVAAKKRQTDLDEFASTYQHALESAGYGPCATTPPASREPPRDATKSPATG